MPRSGDVDFRDEVVAARAKELANELGNLVNRTIALAGKRRVGDAADAVWSLVAEANRFVSHVRPWELEGDERDAAVNVLLSACDAIVREIEPFLPAAAARISEALPTRDRELGRALFRKPG